MVPFRESKLTLLFRDCFLGTNTGGVSMIVNASPSPADFDETLHALKYGALTKEVSLSQGPTHSAPKTIYDYHGRVLHSKRVSRSRPSSQDLYSQDLSGAMSSQDMGPRGGSMRGSRPPSQDLTGARPGHDIPSRGSSMRVRPVPEITEEDEEKERLIRELAEVKLEFISLESEIREEVAIEMKARLQELEHEYAARMQTAIQIEVNQAKLHLDHELRRKEQDGTQASQQLVCSLEDLKELNAQITECEEEMDRMREMHREEVGEMQGLVVKGVEDLEVSYLIVYVISIHVILKLLNTILYLD